MYATTGIAPPPDARTPLVLISVQDLASSVESAAQTLERLEQKLGPVLSVSPRLASGGAGTAGPRPAAPPLVENLRGVQQHVEELDRRIRDLTDRLEV